MEVLSFCSSDISKGARLLKEGKLVAFPTETVFGVGCIYNSKKAYKNLNKLKKRVPDKPYTLMLSSLTQAKKFVNIKNNLFKFLKKFLPGSVTFVLPAKNTVPKYIAPNGFVGIRIPNFPLTLKILRKSGPLLVPSLNRSNEPPLFNLKDIQNEFGNELDAIYFTSIKKDKPSTVVLISDKISILREGKVSSKLILKEYKSYEDSISK